MQWDYSHWVNKEYVVSAGSCASVRVFLTVYIYCGNPLQFIRSFINSFHGLSYDRSHTLFQGSLSLRVQSSASSFNYQYPLVPLNSSIGFLRLLSRLPVTSVLSSIFSSITCFRRQFPSQMWPIRLVYFFLWYVGYSFPAWFCVILLHFSHCYYSKWSYSSSTTLQNFLGISGLFSEVSELLHCTKLCSKYIALLISSLS